MHTSKFSPILEKKQFKLLDKLVYRYLLSLPPTYNNDSNAKWPMIMFLHGSGESSDDLELAKKHGIPRLVQVYDNWRCETLSKDDILSEGIMGPVKIKEKDSSVKPIKPMSLDCAKFVAENFITITPQVDPSRGGYGWKPDNVIKLLDELEKDYRLDNDRVYLTGVSMGGFGTFNTATKYPHRFTAIIPVCGGGDKTQAEVIKHLPTWVFHGRKDDIVPISSSESMVKAMRKFGSDAKFTIYPEADHDSWTDTYNNIEIYSWLLSQKRT